MRLIGPMPKPPLWTCGRCPVRLSPAICTMNGRKSAIAASRSGWKAAACNCSRPSRATISPSSGCRCCRCSERCGHAGCCRHDWPFQMIKIALTGSIGMGKSTVARMFERAGVPVFDADAEVRRLQARGGALVEAIGRRFPGSVRHSAVDRDALSERVLGRPEELAALEAIIHPAVEQAREAFMADHGDAPALLFDIPLLFETGAEGAFDTVIVASAPAGIQRE